MSTTTAPAPPVPTGEARYPAGLPGLLRFAAERRAALLAALVLAMAADAATLVQPYLTGRLLEAVATGRAVAGTVTVLVLVFASGAVLSGIGSYLLSRVGEGVVRDLRVRLGGHLLRVTVGEHDNRRAGDLLSRASGDTMMLRGIVTRGPISAVTGVITLVASIVLMGLVDLPLLGATLAMMAVSFGIIFTIMPRVKPATLRAAEGIGNLIACLDRSLRAIRTVKASRAEDREAAQIADQARSAYEAGLRVGAIQAMISPAIALGVNGSFLVVLGLGGEQVATGHMSVAKLITFLLYLTTLAVPLVSVGQLMADLQSGLAAFERVNEVLALPLEPAGRPADPGAVVPGRDGAAAEIRFDRVEFGYRDRPVLDGVSFRIPAGSHTAVVGPSGAGKSTILALVERFYEADGGRVEVAGVDVKRIPLNELRRMIAYVEQEAPVLAGTVEENIRYANPEADPAAVAAVVDRVRLSGLIEQLPQGLATDVGDAGVLMSGGERQRVAIARALLGTPRVLLLDEATSQLDALNELAMRQTVRAVAGPSCTVVTVAHRLSTVVDADQIIVLADGKVAGTGTHDELLAANEVYRDLVQGQLLSAGDVLLVPEEPEVLAAGADALDNWRESGVDGSSKASGA